MPVRTDFAGSTWNTPTVRPLIMARDGLIAAGHYRATTAGYHILRSGGNAIDAGVAAGVALNVVLFTLTSFGGVAPVVLHHAETGRTVTLDGLGVWPQRASVDYFERHHNGEMPEGILRSVTPGAPDSWLTALQRFGTLTLGEVLEPAWELAAKGSPLSVRVAAQLKDWEARIEGLDPVARDIFFPGGIAPRAGQVLVQEDLGKLFRTLMDEEARARRQGASREAGIGQARDLIYRGWIAEKVSRFHEENGGWMRQDDLANHRVEIAEPVHGTYRGYDIFTCGPWCQGPMLVQFLNILENFDLVSLKHNSAEYLHVLIEAMDLVFSDRENFYADPRVVDVPLDGLLSKEYARERARQLSRDRATGHMPDPGNPWIFEPGGADRSVHPVDVTRHLNAGPARGDTSYVACVDNRGNVFSATPSDPVFWTPIIPGLGFSMSGRGSQSRPYTGHPSTLAPGKRPRLTPNPALVMLDGKPLMGIGCPGGDAQTQGMLQVLVNMIDFGANVQQAIEAPRVTSLNFPNSFAPYAYFPGRVDVEGRIDVGVRDSLAQLGHGVGTTIGWSPAASSVHVAIINPENDVLLGGADPRRGGSAIGW